MVPFTGTGTGNVGGLRYGNWKVGTVLRFTYITYERTGASDKFKEVLILHPNWKGKMHAIDLKRLTVAERIVLKTVLDPRARSRKHRIPLINDVLARMDPSLLIGVPLSFYHQFVKPFLRNKDAYRTYILSKVTNAQVVQDSDAISVLSWDEDGDINATRNVPITTNTNPMFKKPLFGK